MMHETYSMFLNFEAQYTIEKKNKTFKCMQNYSTTKKGI